MSITRRILEGAQSGLSRLTSLVIVDDEPLSHVESAALQAELTARKAARAKATRKPLDNPLAKLATSDAAARAQRVRMAAERASRVHRERDERAARTKAAADEAFRRMKEQAARGGPMPSSSSGSSSSGSSSSSSSRRPPRPGSTEAQLAEWYKTLDLPVGADMPAIKTSYRQMMRKYHPDMHAGNPAKQKAANELSMRANTAYNGLLQHFEKK
ncbi:MAG: J domain-containing protein [Deltaproteobacteria bacterium]|nr:J domain-containing protein [Deltaproteobacteria bacterium]MCW5802835.1 J domain-containing protein [Deltaproteobacteria bacterium]